MSSELAKPGDATYVDCLDQDPPIRGQKVACVSFVSPTGNQRANLLGLKVRGIFPSEGDARNYIKRLQEIDPHFNIYTCPVGTWVPWEPDPNDVLEQEYVEPQLNELVKGYKANRFLAEAEERRRKEDLLKQAVLEGQNGPKEEKEHPVSVKDKLDSLPRTIKELQEKLEKTQKRLEEAQSKWDAFTEEEIEKAMQEFEEYKKEAEKAENAANGNTTPHQSAAPPGGMDQERIDTFKQERADALPALEKLKSKVEAERAG